MDVFVIESLIHLVYWLDYWFLFNLIGLVLVGVYLTPEAITKSDQYKRFWFRSWFMTLLLYAVISLIVLSLDVTEICGNLLIIDAGKCFKSLKYSYFGFVWSIKFVALLAVIVMTASCAKRGFSTGLLFLLSLLFVVILFSYAAVSHAANQGILTFEFLGQWLHTVAAIIWGGAILGFYNQLHPIIRPEYASKQEAISAVCRLSRLASISFVLALIAGLYGAWHLSAGFKGLTFHDYGQSLLIKMMLVSGVLIIACRVRFYLIPKLINSQESDVLFTKNITAIKRSISIDRLMIALVVLMAVDVSHKVPIVELVYLP